MIRSVKIIFLTLPGIETSRRPLKRVDELASFIRAVFIHHRLRGPRSPATLVGFPIFWPHFRTSKHCEYRTSVVLHIYRSLSGPRSSKMDPVSAVGLASNIVGLAKELWTLGVFIYKKIEAAKESAASKKRLSEDFYIELLKVESFKSWFVKSQGLITNDSDLDKVRSIIVFPQSFDRTVDVVRSPGLLLLMLYSLESANVSESIELLVCMKMRIIRSSSELNKVRRIRGSRSQVQRLK